MNAIYNDVGFYILCKQYPLITNQRLYKYVLSIRQVFSFINSDLAVYEQYKMIRRLLFFH